MRPHFGKFPVSICYSAILINFSLFWTHTLSVCGLVWSSKNAASSKAKWGTDTSSVPLGKRFRVLFLFVRGRFDRNHCMVLFFSPAPSLQSYKCLPSLLFPKETPTFKKKKKKIVCLLSSTGRRFIFYVGVDETAAYHQGARETPPQERSVFRDQTCCNEL